MRIPPVSNSMNMSLIRMSTMKRINSAADDAAGLAISEKMKAQYSGIDKGTENIQDMSNLMKTAEGSMGSVQENLQRMRELAVQASNGTLTLEDRTVIQDEIDQLKQGISETVSNTEFNTQKLLDGSFNAKNVAMGADGTGGKANISSLSLDSLGISDFSVVSGNFDISKIDNALSQVSENRSSVGSQMNRYEHAENMNRTASNNLKESQSRIADADITKELISLNIGKVMQQYKYYSMKQQTNIEGSKLNLLL